MPNPWTEPTPDPATVARRLIARAWDLRERPPRAPPLTEHPSEPIYGFRVDDRLIECGLDPGWEAFARLFGIDPINLGTRPAATARQCGMAPGLFAADFVCLIAQLSSWGLPVEPTPWVDALRPALLKRHQITHCELRVLWFPREHHRMKETLKVSSWPEGVPETFTTANGRRISNYGRLAHSSPAPRRRPQTPLFANPPALIAAAP